MHVRAGIRIIASKQNHAKRWCMVVHTSKGFFRVTQCQPKW